VIETDSPAGRLLEALGHDPCSLDTLVARVDQPAERVTSTLLELELSGLIEKLPGNNFQRVR
jgi:DNA processing protein